MLRPWLRLTGLVEQQFVRRLQVVGDPRFVSPTMELEDSALVHGETSSNVRAKQSGRESVFATKNHDITGVPYPRKAVADRNDTSV